MTKYPEHPDRIKFYEQLMLLAEKRGKGFGDEYGREDFSGSVYTHVLASGIVFWLDEHPGANCDQYSNWFHYLPEWLDEAFEWLRKSDHHKAKLTRQLFKGAVEERGLQWDIPNLIDTIGGSHRALVASDVARFVARAAARTGSPAAGDGRWIRHGLEEYFGAQELAVTQAWHRFVRVCYRPLIKRINDESHRGNSGMFGQTRLLAWAGMGRVMFTFYRGDNQEELTTFVADDSDEFGHRSGGNFSPTPFMKRIEMIHDVVDHWDIDKLMPDIEVRLAGT